MRRDEPRLDHVIEGGEQRTVEAGAVEENERLGDEPQLIPGEDLERFVERPEATGHHDESGGEFGHAGLAFVHRLDDVEHGQAGVCGLGPHEVLGDDPVHVTARLQHRIGHDAHEPDPAAAVHQAEAGPGDLGAQAPRLIGELGPGPRTRTAVDADEPGHESMFPHSGRMAGR